MTWKAFDAMLALARRAGPLVEGVATGGSSTTIVDTTRLGVLDFLSDDELNGGTAFIIWDAGGQGAAPEAETARITDYVAAAGQVVVASGDFSAAPAAGDIYGVTVVPRYQLYTALNSALADLGDLPAVDESITTTAGTKEYSLPAAVAPEDVCQVYIQTRTTRPFDWERISGWRVVQGASTHNLEFDVVFPAGYKLRIVYLTRHPMLSDDAHSVMSCVPRDYLTWQAAGYVYQRRLLQVGVDREHWTGLMNHAFQMAANALRMQPIVYPQRQRF